MGKIKRGLVAAFVSIMVLSCFATPALAGRTVDEYAFHMYDRNESDSTGVFSNVYPFYIAKVYSYKPAAIRCDHYYGGSYNFKSTLYRDSSHRATTYAWLNTGLRWQPTYVNGYGASGQTFKLWARRDNRETVFHTLALGTWSPDNKNY